MQRARFLKLSAGPEGSRQIGQVVKVGEGLSFPHLSPKEAALLSKAGAIEPVRISDAERASESEATVREELQATLEDLRREIEGAEAQLERVRQEIDSEKKRDAPKRATKRPPKGTPKK